MACRSCADFCEAPGRQQIRYHRKSTRRACHFIFGRQPHSAGGRYSPLSRSALCAPGSREFATTHRCASDWPPMCGPSVLPGSTELRLSMIAGQRFDPTWSFFEAPSMRGQLLVLGPISSRIKSDRREHCAARCTKVVARQFTIIDQNPRRSVLLRLGNAGAGGHLRTRYSIPSSWQNSRLPPLSPSSFAIQMSGFSALISCSASSQPVPLEITGPPTGYPRNRR